VVVAVSQQYSEHPVAALAAVVVVAMLY